MPGPTAPAADLLADLTSAAARHGAASDPDHEVGDLLDALALAWELLSDAQRAEVHRRFFAAHERWEP